MAVSILHILARVGPSSYGLGPVALNLTREQNGLGGDARIWCLDNEQDRNWAATSNGLESGRIRGFAVSGPRSFGFSRSMWQTVKCKSFPERVVVHQHGIWTALSPVTKMLHDRYGFPMVITPHGSLEKWAVRKSGWKKKLALALYESVNLRSASCFHAVGENEIADIRNFGLSNPIALIPNGISDEWLNSSGDGNAFRQRFQIAPDKNMMLFLSRITPKKGLPMLLDAISEIRSQFENWILMIAGADEFGHLSDVKAVVRQKKLEKAVAFVGPVFEQIKRDAFAAANLFILPSHSEGAPVVILEALGAGVPVLATKASPWPQLETHACGWWTDINAAAIAGALRDALNCTPDQLQQMGWRGKELVASRYTWKQSALKTMELYQWLLGRAERPVFVVVN